MLVFGGSEGIALAKKISQKGKFSSGKLDMHIFPDGERRVRVIDKIVGKKTVIVQSTPTPVDQSYMELFFIIDSLKRSGASMVTAVIPYMGYMRQDHVFLEGEAVSISVIIKILESIGTDRVIIVDPHTIRIPDLFSIPCNSLSALPIFAEKIRELLNGSDHLDTVLISPDMGGVRRIRILSDLLSGMQWASIEKNRDLVSGSVESHEIHGNLAKRAIIVDDMISSGGTIKAAAQLLKEKGVEEMYVFATHPVFSEEAPEILEKSLVTKVFVTDTIEIPKQKNFPKLEIISVADIIAAELT